MIDVSGADIQPAATIKSLGSTPIVQSTSRQHLQIKLLPHTSSTDRIAVPNTLARDSLPDDVARTVKVSIVTSHLDYCNDLYMQKYLQPILTNCSDCRTLLPEFYSRKESSTISLHHLPSFTGCLYDSELLSNSSTTSLHPLPSFTGCLYDSELLSN